MRVPFKFSLRTLLGAIFVVAFASLAVAQKSKLWAIGFLNLAFILLVHGLLAALFRRGPTRASCSALG